MTTMLAISEESAREEFFRLWCRKEAYGKMTGEGAAPYLKRSMLEMPKGFMAWDKAFTLRGVKYFQSIIETCVEEK